MSRYHDGWTKWNSFMFYVVGGEIKHGVYLNPNGTIEKYDLTLLRGPEFCQ